MWLTQWFKAATKRNEFGIPVRNLGKVTDAVYRGGHPCAEGYEALVRTLGVRRVLSLTDRVEANEKQRALAAGVRDWLNIRFDEMRVPEPTQVRDSLDYIRTATSANPVYTHCMGGRHRTGLIVAVLRVTDCGWTKRQALKEMWAYGYFDVFGHRSQLRWFLREFDPKDYARPDGPALGGEPSDPGA